MDYCLPELWKLQDSNFTKYLTNIHMSSAERPLKNIKVFGIGLPKTGTTSLGEALELIGYQVCNENLGSEDEDIEINVRGRMAAAVQRYDAFQDVPWCSLFEYCDELCPGAKFILTVRDECRWIHSMGIFADRSIPILRLSFGRSVVRSNEQLFLERFRGHNEKVKKHFRERPNTLLVLPLELPDHEKMQLLTNFLGVTVDQRVKFPRVNVGRRNAFRWHLGKIRQIFFRHRQ